MQVFAVLLLGWTVFCVWAAWRAGGPRLLLLPVVLLVPVALTPVYVAFAYPAYETAPGRMIGGILLIGLTAFAVRRGNGTLLALIGLFLAWPFLAIPREIALQPAVATQALAAWVARYPVPAFVYATRALALVAIFFIVLRRPELLRTRLPGASKRDDQPEAGR